MCKAPESLNKFVILQAIVLKHENRHGEHKKYIYVIFNYL